MGVIAWLSEKPKKLGDYVRSSANFVVGLGLCLLSLMSFTEAEGNFAFSSWVLPTLCLSLFLGEFLFLDEIWWTLTKFQWSWSTMSASARLQAIRPTSSRSSRDMGCFSLNSVNIPVQFNYFMYC